MMGFAANTLWNLSLCEQSVLQLAARKSGRTFFCLWYATVSKGRQKVCQRVSGLTERNMRRRLWKSIWVSFLEAFLFFLYLKCLCRPGFCTVTKVNFWTRGGKGGWIWNKLLAWNRSMIKIKIKNKNKKEQEGRKNKIKTLAWNYEWHWSSFNYFIAPESHL